MALLQINFYSTSLKREVAFNALIPMEQAEQTDTGIKPLKSLYLLHGYSDSHTDWLTRTRIRELSEKYRIAVFMPSGENKFYLDIEHLEEWYGEYIGRELLEFTRRMFPLSRNREDTFIGGLSMGGYGAIRNGLRYGDRFGRIIALSSALISYKVVDMKPGFHSGIASYDYYRNVFGEPGSVMGSDKDPEELVRQLRQRQINIPEIYMACGTEDFLLDVNQRFHQFLAGEDIGHTYLESPGAHTWDFWNDKIADALEWAFKA